MNKSKLDQLIWVKKDCLLSQTHARDFKVRRDMWDAAYCIAVKHQLRWKYKGGVGFGIDWIRMYR